METQNQLAAAVFEASGLSLRECARRIGVSAPHLHNVVHDQTPLTANVLAGMRREFGAQLRMLGLRVRTKPVPDRIERVPS